MKKHYNIIIAGAGGIAEAVGLLLAEWSHCSPTIYIGNRTLAKAEKVAKWIQNGTTKQCEVHAFHLPEDGISNELVGILKKGDALLDCLPGSLAPKMAQFARDYNLHYANLTEYVAETNQIIALAKNASTGFILQTGLAPGYINVLANHLFQQFCADYNVDTVDTLNFKVGALTDHAIAPHYYGFTWSPVGVATEYIKDCVVVRSYKKTMVPALSQRATLIINGFTYEEDLTSGGAADLPDALAGKVETLDYKTLRHLGHYDWIETQLAQLQPKDHRINMLQQKMQDQIPHIEDDQIVLYAAVQGKDASGILRRREIAKKISPLQVGKHTLRAIQTTTAVPLIQSIQQLLDSEIKGVLLQSEIDTHSFLHGDFIIPVYGKPNHYNKSL